MDSEKKKYMFCGAICLVLIFICAYFLCRDVSDSGAGIKPIREQLTTATEEQREFTKGIEGAEARIENIQERVSKSEAGIDAATNRAENVERDITSSGELIKECQQILRDICARGEEKNESN